MTTDNSVPSLSGSTSLPDTGEVLPPTAPDLTGDNAATVPGPTIDDTPSDPIEPQLAPAQTVLAFLRVSAKDGAGSYGAVVREGQERWAVGERREGVTVNTMELVGATRLLNDIIERRGPSSVTIFASLYLADNYKRIPIWRAQKWFRRSHYPVYVEEEDDGARSAEPQWSYEQDRIVAGVANVKQWMALDEAIGKHTEVSIQFLPSKGPAKAYWNRERKVALAIAQRTDASSFSWVDISGVFASTFDLAKLSIANDNDR